MINKVLVSKNNAVKYVLLYPFLLIAILVATYRAENLPDYQMYYYMYQTHIEDVELSFRILNEFFYPYQNGFIYFLLVYAVLGVFIKINSIYNYISKYNGIYPFILFIFVYISFFYINWDLIQIRYSVGVSFLIAGILAEKKIHSLIFFVISLFFHSSMFLPILLFILISFFKNFSIQLCIGLILGILVFLIFKYTFYAEKYEFYGREAPSIISGQYLITMFMLALNFFMRKNSTSADRGNIILNMAFSMFVTMLLIKGSYGAVADRMYTLVEFLLLINLLLIRERYFSILFFLFLIFYVFWHWKIFILVPQGLLTPV
jgi:hypothetical protein